MDSTNKDSIAVTKELEAKQGAGINDARTEGITKLILTNRRGFNYLANRLEVRVG